MKNSEKKRLSKTIVFFAVVLLAGSFFVSCTREIDEKEKTVQTETVERTLESGGDVVSEQENPGATESIGNENVTNNDSEKNTEQPMQTITGNYMEGDDELKIIGEVEETEDRKIVYEVAKEVTKAYFQDDQETIKKYLAEDYMENLYTYLDSGIPYEAEAVTIYGIKGLSGVGDEIGESYTVQVEFLPAEDDSMFYLFMDFVKQECGWRISGYGLEK